jgi:hypothetical protein
MAALRSRGPCARRAPSSGRSGGGRSRGPQHAGTLSGGRAGDPCAGPVGPGLHLAGGVCGAAGGSTCSQRARSQAGQPQEGAGLLRVVPGPPALN